MQIHELTQPKQEQLDELVGGLARMAGQAIAKSPVGQAVGAAKQAFQKSAVGQTLQKAGDLERQAKISAQTQALAKNTLQTWNDRVIRLTQAAGGFPVDETTYRNNLNDFVQKVMLGNKPINSLDALSQPKITGAIDAVVTDRNDRAKMQTAFNNLVTQATVARTGASTAGQSAQPQAQQSGTASTAGPAQTSQAKNFLSSLISTPQQQGLAQYLQGATVASTKNADVDGFLNALGVKTR
jgi:hypothetical protein